MKSLQHRAEYGALRGLVRVLGAVPWDRAGRIGAKVGAMGFRPLGVRRRVVERQIAAAFPELSDEQVADLARRSYEHLGRSAIETALLPGLGQAGVLRLVSEVENWDVVERAKSAGKGIIIVSGHLGNWELAAAYLAARGVPFDVIVRKMGNPLFDRYLNQTREQLGVNVVYDAQAVRQTPRALRQGRAVGFVADQGVRGLASTFVPFFGRPAKTPRGAGVFALRFGSPVIFIAALRKPDGSYLVGFEEIPVVETGDRERDVDSVVLRFTQVLEKWVRRAPDQYFWQHRRWRRQPPGTPPELRDPAAEGS
ncbi:MAG TPA: lysophospholipid acyltransferase family protein [Gemmatimonadaceae bacterium]|nr:lysophospholipid acyltransferase family protein [Gemmatimonadaceae bacterium]